MSQCPDYLHALTLSMMVPELLDCLCITQEHDTMIGKYWLLACSIHADHNMVYNFIGEFLTFKGQLYVPKNLVLTIFHEYHDARRDFG